MLSALPQILLNSLVACAVYSLVASGLTLIYGVLKFVNFAYAEFTILCGYIFYAFFIIAKLPIVLSVILTLAIAVILSLLIEKLTYRPIAHTGEFTPLMVSIGTGLILKSITEAIFGTQLLTYDLNITKTITFFNSCTSNCTFASASITYLQIAITFVSILTFLFLYCFLYKTQTGKAIRAMADNRNMAKVLGLKVNILTQIVFIITAILASISGILIGLEYFLHPSRGTSFGIKAFSAVIIGGKGSVKGAIVGSMIIALSENIFTSMQFFSNGYKDAIAFFVLTVILLYKPQGLFGGGKEVLARKE